MSRGSQTSRARAAGAAAGGARTPGARARAGHAGAARPAALAARARAAGRGQRTPPAPPTRLQPLTNRPGAPPLCLCGSSCRMQVQRQRLLFAQRPCHRLVHIPRRQRVHNRQRRRHNAHEEPHSDGQTRSAAGPQQDVHHRGAGAVHPPCAVCQPHHFHAGRHQRRRPPPQYYHQVGGAELDSRRCIMAFGSLVPCPLGVHIPTTDCLASMAMRPRLPDPSQSPATKAPSHA